MFDIFYLGTKPNQFVHEQPADSIEHAQSLSKTRYCWVINYLLDYSNFDFLWEPAPWQSKYTHVWLSQWDEFYGAYLIPKYSKIEYHHHNTVIPAKQFPDNYRLCKNSSFDQSWVPHPWDPPYIYVFGNQWWPAQKMPTVEYHVPDATERKYMSWPRANLLPDSTHWSVPDNLDTSDFDFSWHPDPGSPPYIYQFATQHQKTGGPVYTVPGGTEIKYLSDLKARTTQVATATYEIDHLDGAAGQIPNVTRRVRYFDNYRDTLIRLAKSIGTEHEYVWVCSSICDYTDFDFSWHPEAWQSTMLHVFASNDQKFGDTFFMHVPTFAEQAEKKALLDWYDVNYVPDISVPRRPMPVVYHKDDTHVEAVKRTDWAGPLAVFTVDLRPATLPTVSLWRQETKTIVPLSTGASAVIVPKTAKSDVRTQLYDYPFIDKTRRKQNRDQALDIVFVSNGESNAHNNWIKLTEHTSYLPNRVVKVDGVKGRVASQHAAAQAATTPWYFVVFAKLDIDTQFDWAWQPDRMQQPKHYIFHALNPINGLMYGHQATVLYNRDLVLSNTGYGLDFTLDSAHEVVPVLSGVARYNDTPWMTWRTAFREAIKLQCNSDIESQYRLQKWLETPKVAAENWEWSVRGAQDAVEYYHLVNGDFAELRKSYDWAWLASYVFLRHGLVAD